jgi:hypothetical protein
MKGHLYPKLQNSTHYQGANKCIINASIASLLAQRGSMGSANKKASKYPIKK